MPITPRFELSQSLTHLTVEIRVPHVRVSAETTEVLVDGPRLHFSSPPYLLVLTFPANLADPNSTSAAQKGCSDDDHDDDGVVATFDPSKNGGMITLTIAKEVPGLWPDLDLMGTLLAPTKRETPAATRKRIEIIDETSFSHVADEGDVDKVDDSDQRPDVDVDPSCGPSSRSLSCDIRNALQQQQTPHYGFLNMYSCVFNDLTREGLATEMLQLVDPDATPAKGRRALRLAREAADFDGDRYLGDNAGTDGLEDDYIYQMAMLMTPHWQRGHASDQHVGATGGSDVDVSDVESSLAEHFSKLTTSDHVKDIRDNDDHQQQHSFFTTEEAAQLASIPYPLLPNVMSPREVESLLMGLLDILFAHVYDHLTTDGEPTVESSWTVCTLSSTLSWLDTFHVVDVAENGDSTRANDGDDVMASLLELVMAHSIRRVLIYPYLRNYGFALHCWREVAHIVKNGRRCIIRCLLQVRSILDKSECHYLGNRLYVDPYLAWIQQQRLATDTELSRLWKRLYALLKECKRGRALQKSSLGLGLVEFERDFMEEEEQDDSASDGDDDDVKSSDSEGSESESEQASNETDESSDSNWLSLPDTIKSEVSCENQEGNHGATTRTTTSAELLDSESSICLGRVPIERVLKAEFPTLGHMRVDEQS